MNKGDFYSASRQDVTDADMKSQEKDERGNDTSRCIRSPNVPATIVEKLDFEFQASHWLTAGTK